MRRRVAVLVIAIVFITGGPLASADAYPPYAKEGAFASYTAEGGFIPYFSGVSGNITYTVVALYQNGSMYLRVYENITAGTDLSPFLATLNFTDSIRNPHSFPAVALSNLSSYRIKFQAVAAVFQKNDTVSVPAGQFRAMEFSGTDANGTQVHFWFDGKTGLVVEMSSGTGVLELDSSNIAVPSAHLSAYDTELPFLLVFVFAFILGGGSFLWLRRHYGRPKIATPPSPQAQS